MRATLIFFAVAVLTLVLVMLYRPDPEAPARQAERAESPASMEGRQRSEPASVRRTESRNESAGAEDSSSTTPTGIEPQEEADRPDGGYDAIGRSFHASEDYHAFVESLEEAATEGNASAQYYMYRALSQCQLAVSRFDGEYPDSTDLARARPASADSREVEMMNAQVERCRGFFEADPGQYGHAQGWLDEAAANGYGPAVMEKGTRDFRHWQAGRETDFDPASVMETLRQRNPETLAQAANLARSGNASPADQAAWELLSCKYGRDCSRDADWVRALCLQEGCPPDYENAEQALSTALGPGGLERARARMESIEEALDQGNFDALFR
jgi:hypothetical protein